MRWMIDSARTVAVVLAIVTGMSVVCIGAAAQDPELSGLLERAATYLAAFGPKVSGIVAKENYLQEVRSLTPSSNTPGMHVADRSRRLLSDFSFLADEQEGWIEFRDVQSVNGQEVGQRERVIDLLANPSPNARLQARRIAEYGARFNLMIPAAIVNRTINLPMSALLFLKGSEQRRSVFTLGRRERIDGTDAVVLQFQETATPRLIGSDAGHAASGSFWIEPTTGAVVQSELKFTTGSRASQTRATIRVRYTPHPRFDVMLPAWMDEEYETSGTGDSVILGARAVYDDYRRFGVTTDEDVALPVVP